MVGPGVFLVGRFPDTPILVAGRSVGVGCLWWYLGFGFWCCDQWA